MHKLGNLKFLANLRGQNPNPESSLGRGYSNPLHTAFGHDQGLVGPQGVILHLSPHRTEIFPTPQISVLVVAMHNIKSISINAYRYFLDNLTTLH